MAATIFKVGPACASCWASGAQHGDLIEAAASVCDPSFNGLTLAEQLRLLALELLVREHVLLM